MPQLPVLVPVCEQRILSQVSARVQGRHGSRCFPANKRNRVVRRMAV